MGFGKDGRGAILRESSNIDLGTLGASTAMKAAAQLAITEDFRLIKSEIFIHVKGMTAAEGPVTFGIADNELSVAEIAACLGVDGPLDRNDRVATETVERPVWEICHLYDGLSTALVPNDNMPIEKVLRWTFSNDDGWTFFAFNRSGAALTTGAVVTFSAKHFGVWVT